MEDQNPEVIRDSADKADEDVETTPESDTPQQSESESAEEDGGQQVLPETDLG